MCFVSAPSHSDRSYPAPGVEVLLPAGLADAAGGSRSLVFYPDTFVQAPGSGPVRGGGGATVADVLGTLQDLRPGVYHRIVDESGSVRRHVNLYVDGRDIRDLDGFSTVVQAGAVVLVLQSIAGG